MLCCVVCCAVTVCVLTVCCPGLQGFMRSYTQLPLQSTFNAIIPAAIAGMHSRRGLDVGGKKKAMEMDHQQVLEKVSVSVVLTVCVCVLFTLVCVYCSQCVY